jgi:hypothetical protein
MSALTAIMASGLLYYFSTNLGTLWPLARIAPAPVLWYALGQARPARVALVAFAAFVAGEINLIPVYSSVVPITPLVAALALPAAAFAGIVFLTGRLGPTLPPAAGVLLFPALWTAWEYLSLLYPPTARCSALPIRRSLSWHSSRSQPWRAWERSHFWCRCYPQASRLRCE